MGYPQSILDMDTKKLTYFDGVDDLPAHRHFDFNLFSLMEASGGGGIDGILQNLSLAIQHQNAKDYGKTSAIISNLSWQIITMRERLSPLQIAHAAMVKTIDGEDVSRLTAEAVEKLLKDEPIKVGFMRNCVNAFKKKIDSEIAATHPQYGSSRLAETVAVQEREMLLLNNAGIQTGTFDEAKIASVEMMLLSMHEPKEIAGAKGLHMTGKKSASVLFGNMERLGYKDPRMMCVFDFYTALEEMEKKK